MFADLLRRLTSPEPDRLPDPEADLALAAVLVRLARSDGDYAAEEIARIDAVLMRRHDLTAEAAMALRGKAETLEAEAPDTVRFTRAIKDAVAYEDRIGVIEALWEIALADGERDHEEDAMMRMVTSLLGVTDQDSARARHRASERG